MQWYILICVTVCMYGGQHSKLHWTSYSFFKNELFAWYVMHFGVHTLSHFFICLANWGRDKMAAFSQTTLSNAFSWMKQLEFIKISLKFVPKGLVNNTPALVLIMTWRRPGDKPLSEPMIVSLPTHICVTRPQWVNVLDIHQLYEYNVGLLVYKYHQDMLPLVMDIFVRNSDVHDYSTRQAGLLSYWTGNMTI